MLALISFLVGTSQFVIAGILDKVASSVGVSIATAGQLITVFALANAIGTPIIMMATAKLDRRKQLLLALIILLVGIASTLALPGFIFLMASRIILGVASGVFVVTAYAVVAELAPSGRQGRAMSNVAMGFSTSLVFGVPIGRVIAAAYDWKTIFWGIGLLSLLAVFIIARVIPATKGEAPVSLGKQLALLKRPQLAIALGVTFFAFIGYSIVNTYITPFLSSVVSINDRGVSVILFVLGIASLIGSKAGGFFSDRIGTSRTLIGGLIVQALALVFVYVAYGSIGAAVSLLIIWMIAAWTFGPSQNYNLVSAAPEASGIMLSLNSSFVQLGFAVGAGIGGIASGGGSMLPIIWMGAAAVALAAFISIVSVGLVRPSLKKMLRKS
jgi:DHA1 family putative efflux transporter-like MFS transporter